MEEIKYSSSVVRYFPGEGLKEKITFIIDVNVELNKLKTLLYFISLPIQPIDFFVNNLYFIGNYWRTHFTDDFFRIKIISEQLFLIELPSGVIFKVRISHAIMMNLGVQSIGELFKRESTSILFTNNKYAPDYNDSADYFHCHVSQRRIIHSY